MFLPSADSMSRGDREGEGDPLGILDEGWWSLKLPEKRGSLGNLH